ncbi:MAG TPA: formyltetrahydrofolate deformylase [Acidimicrobiia bacterium]|nr:formyltetrahydrofolate deformylase [Acidimicrobiia bacterium]
MRRYVLTLSCPDRPGIVNAVTGALLEVQANILESAQFGDIESHTFALRTVFETEHDDQATVEPPLAAVSASLSGLLKLRAMDVRPRALVMVSKYDHCLLDLLHRQRHGELAIDIPLIVSNHPDCAELAGHYGVPYVHIPVTEKTKADAEARLLALIEEHVIDFVVLARYMQILSPETCRALAGRAINIHHSFLPGFKGSRPYHQAHHRGVKLIGATAHYVTVDLDEGPIIDQDVARVTHAHSPEDLVSIGRDVERMVLARAVRYHAEERVILIGSKTVVFT